MFAAELRFRSWVAVAGHRWVRYQDLGAQRGTNAPESYLKGWVLTENYSSTRPEPRRYGLCDPFADHPALYREFAAIPRGDRNAAVAFANQYGMLDSDTRLNFPAYPLPAGAYISSRSTRIPCDPEDHWNEYPALFRGLIRVWEGRKAKRTSDLAKLFRWERVGTEHMWVWHPDPVGDDSQGMLVRPVYREWETKEAGTEANSDLADGTGDVARSAGATPWPAAPRLPWNGMEDMPAVADAFLRQEISKGLGHGYPYRLRFNDDAEGTGTRFEVAPQNLIGALFLQFGRAVAGDKDHRPCKECGKWFELVPQDKGRREFCRAACKVKDYRDRKKRAVELKATGQTPQQIAKATGTELETVKRWVGRKGQTKRKGK